MRRKCSLYVAEAKYRNEKSVRFVWLIWYGFSVNPPSIFLIDRKMCYVDYVGLRWFGHSFTAVVFVLGTYLGTFFGQ